MDKNEFIKNACTMGYCSRLQALKYCKDKDHFTEEDYIEVFRMAQDEECRHIDRPLPGGGRTTKRYFTDGDD